MRRTEWRRSAALCAASLVAGARLAAMAGEVPRPGADTLNPLHGLAKDALSGFRDRPLFNPSRAEPRAPEATPPAAPPPPEPVVEPPPAIRLVGIVSGPQTLAMVRPADGGKTTLLATGDRLGSWTATVTPEGLTLQNAGQTATFSLFQHGSGAGQESPNTAPGASASAPPAGDPSQR